MPQMEDHSFLILTPKFHHQNHYTWQVITENVHISGIPILIFWCIFITASSPVSHSYLCLRRANRKWPLGKIAQNVSQGSRLISWEWKNKCQNGHILLQVPILRSYCGRTLPNWSPYWWHIIAKIIVFLHLFHSLLTVFQEHLFSPPP